jgi:hypothetical protein
VDAGVDVAVGALQEVAEQVVNDSFPVSNLKNQGISLLNIHIYGG